MKGKDDFIEQWKKRGPQFPGVLPCRGEIDRWTGRQSGSIFFWGKNYVERGVEGGLGSDNMILRPRTRSLDFMENREPWKTVEPRKASGTVFY